MSSIALILSFVRNLPGPAAFDFHRNGPAQKRSNDDQQCEGHYLFSGWLHGYRADDVRSDQKLEPKLQCPSDRDFQVVIGIRPFLLIVDQSPESCIDKADADYYNANKLQPLRGKFYDLHG